MVLTVHTWVSLFHNILEKKKGAVSVLGLLFSMDQNDKMDLRHIVFQVTDAHMKTIMLNRILNTYSKTSNHLVSKLDPRWWFETRYITCKQMGD